MEWLFPYFHKRNCFFALIFHELPDVSFEMAFFMIFCNLIDFYIITCKSQLAIFDGYANMKWIFPTLKADWCNKWESNSQAIYHSVLFDFGQNILDSPWMEKAELRVKKAICTCYRKRMFVINPLGLKKNVVHTICSLNIFQPEHYSFLDPLSLGTYMPYIPELIIFSCESSGLMRQRNIRVSTWV